MSSDSRYDFNVPYLRNLNDSGDHGMDNLFSTPAANSPRKRMRRSLTRTPKIPEPVSDKKESTSVVEDPMTDKENSNILSNKKSSVVKPKSDHFELPVHRQSPRLASIAKALLPNLKANAKPPISYNRSKAHRRSLSDGAIVKQFASKVKKNMRKQNRQVLSSSGLTNEDKSALHSISNFNESLAFNRKRSMKNLGPTKLCPTKPQEFKFETDKRLGVKTSQDKDQESGLEFARTLRSRSTTNYDLPKGPTKVVPFKLHQSHKDEQGSSSQVPFLSMAELNMKFYTKTPDRFRSSKRNAIGGPISAKAFELTVPHTPTLSTRSRTRGVAHCPSQEDLEQKEYEEVMQNQFKARPLNPKVFNQPREQNLERKKTVTVIEEFDITDSKRAKVKESIGGQLNAALRSFAGSNMALNAIPHRGVPCNYVSRRTEPKPFSFEKRNQAMMEKKKEKVEKIIEEEQALAKFTAGPMPIYEDGITYGVPNKRPPTPTRPKPFNLRIDERGNLKQKYFKSKVEEEEQELASKRRFHAQPDTVLHREPFIPAKSTKPLTDISGFTLNTEQRNDERMAYQIHLKEKEDELAQAKRELEERKRVEEEAEIAKIRKEVVHRPKPIPNYKPMNIKRGLLPTTVPLSPEFTNRTRASSRASQNSSVNQ